MSEALEYMFNVTGRYGIRESVTDHLDIYNVVEVMTSWSVWRNDKGEPIRLDPVVHVQGRFGKDNAIVLLGGGNLSIIVIWCKDATTAHTYVATCHGWGNYQIPNSKIVSVLKFTEYGLENITEEWKE